MNTLRKLCPMILLIILAMVTSPSHAALELLRTRYALAPNRSNQSLPLYVTGGEPISGINLRAQIGDGIGPDFEPLIQDVLFTGLWSAHPSEIVLPFDPAYPQYAHTSVAFSDFNQSTPAHGIFASLLLDTTSLTSGTYTLAFSNTHIGEPTAFLDPDGNDLLPDFPPCELIVNPLPGDANLDGFIDADDYRLLDTGYLLGLPPEWLVGDFNFDNHIDLFDYAILDASFQDQYPLLPNPHYLPHLIRFGPAYQSAYESHRTSIPEPASLILLLLMSPLLTCRCQDLRNWSFANFKTKAKNRMIRF